MLAYKHFDELVKKYKKIYIKCSNQKNQYIKKLIKLKMNKLGYHLGLEIPLNILKENTMIYHQNIVINSNVQIGNNVKFHGNNCIGNKGDDGPAPIIGNNVDIGFGAILIGDIKIADNCKIGAGAIVISSFLEEGSIIVGNPARKVK